MQGSPGMGDVSCTYYSLFAAVLYSSMCECLRVSDLSQHQAHALVLLITVSRP